MSVEALVVLVVAAGLGTAAVRWVLSAPATEPEAERPFDFADPADGLTDGSFVLSSEAAEERPPLARSAARIAAAIAVVAAILAAAVWVAGYFLNHQLVRVFGR